MDTLLDALLLIAAGAAMGFVNNLAGAGGAIGLLAFDVSGGLGAVTANASLRLSAVTLTASGAAGFLTHHQPFSRRALGYGLLTVPGAIAGSIMAVRLPVWIYEATLALVVLVLLVQMLHRPDHRRNGFRYGRIGQTLAFLGVGVYMGFVQVGTGLVAMAALRHVHSHDLVSVNAAKMVVVGFAAVTSLLFFALDEQIAWQPACWLAAGAAAGSFVASRLSVMRGQGLIRAVVIVVCLVVLVRSGFRLFDPS